MQISASVRSGWMKQSRNFRRTSMSATATPQARWKRSGNIYPREYSRMFYEGQKRMGRKILSTLCAVHGSGSQKYGALVWSGDIFSTYEDFRKQICAGLHMGLSRHSVVDNRYRRIPRRCDRRSGLPGSCLCVGSSLAPSARLCVFTETEDQEKRSSTKAGEVREGTGADNEVWSFGEKL